MKNKLLVFNWKMNPNTLRDASVLAQASDYENVVVAPPFPFLESVADTLIKAKLGAQDVFYESKGAFTGEVSAGELKNICVEYVIIGHSERRHKLGETDEIIAKKMKTATDAGLIPILCVGETKAEKDAGQRERVIERQLEKGLSLVVGQLSIVNCQLLIAYEPVWAIGTGDPETTESARETIQFIKKTLSTFVPTGHLPQGDNFSAGGGSFSEGQLSTKVLYGGSVNSQNLGDYIKYNEIDGALVGGASLKKDEVEKMVKIANGN